MTSNLSFQSITVAADSIPLDIVVNGFSIKDTIFDILSNRLDSEISETLSEEIKEAVAVKMRLKQG